MNVFLDGIHSVNLGDDLFFKIILDRYKDTHFIMYAPSEYRKIFMDYANCTVISDTDNCIKFLRKISCIFKLPQTAIIYLYLIFKYNIKLYLLVGGSLFMEGNSNWPKLLSFLNKIKLFVPNFKLVVLGSNYGPEKTSSWLDSVRHSLLKADDVCFRDLFSYTLFSDLTNVRYANDIVMHMPITPASRKEKRIIVNIRSVDSWETLKVYKDKYLETTLHIIEHYISQGYNVQLLSFCNKYHDDTITSELYGMISDTTNVNVINYEGNIKECLKIISESECILATRFHAVILGLIFGLKIFPVSYSNKTENMMKSLGIWNPIYSYNQFCNSTFDQIIDKAVSGFSVSPSYNVQFEVLDRFLL